MFNCTVILLHIYINVNECMIKFWKGAGVEIKMKNKKTHS